MSNCRTRNNHINGKQTAQDFGWKPKEIEIKDQKAIRLLESLVESCENNTGSEPSLSCYYRSLDEAKVFLSGISNNQKA